MVAVGVSQYVADRFADHGLGGQIDGKVEVVYNAPYATKRVATTNTPEIPGSFSLGFLGRISADKGVELVIDAFAAADFPHQATLRIAGEGDPGYIRELQLRHADLMSSGRLSFVGKVDPGEFYGGCDAALIPTQWPEPFGRVAAEALLCGVPVIVSNVGGLPEVLKIYGGRSLLVNSWNSPAAWKQAIEIAARNKWSVTPAHPAPSPTEQYLKVYELALSRRSAASPR